ncbi:MAG: serine/threonine protein kinase, partial [Cyanobacteria bacterium J083]
TPWHIVNKGTNGTFVDGILVSKATLKDGSTIQLAKQGPLFRFNFLVKPAATIPSQPSSVPSTIKSESISHSVATPCHHADNPPNNLFCIHCGEPIVEQENFVRNYQILKSLGKGGMGTTYLALDRSKFNPGTSPFLLVIKEMNADMLEIAKAKELFDREARILQSLEHAGIPTYYDFFLEGDRKYLAMELVHGQNLEQMIYEQGPVSSQQAIEWMLQLCDILKYLHSLSPPLIHRDIKPANLMRRHLDKKIVLLDFGAVKEIGTPLATRIGAEGYSAPEQNRGKPTPQSDIYAIAPTLIFLLTGHNPVEYFRRRGGRFIFDVSGVPNIPPKLAQLIVKVSEYQAKDRYQTAAELEEALKLC